MWEVKGKVLDEKNKEHIYIGMKKGNQNYRNYRISSCLIPNSKATHYFHLKPKHKVYFIRIFFLSLYNNILIWELCIYILDA